MAFASFGFIFWIIITCSSQEFFNDTMELTTNSSLLEIIETPMSTTRLTISIVLVALLVPLISALAFLLYVHIMEARREKEQRRREVLQEVERSMYWRNRSRG